MLFNSFSYFIFLTIVFIVYWFFLKRNLGSQNLFLLVASYFFYACWDYRFLALLIFSTLLDYFTGIQIERSESGSIKRVWLWISIVVNIGFLGVFKYYDFFALSFTNFFLNIGLNINPTLLNIILPVGISFYTFHGLSYVIDIYKGKIRSESNFITYSLFVSFFPLLVAGPIERATHLLPQIKNERSFSYQQAMNGIRQFLWGLFKKIVVADNCAQYVDVVFPSFAEASSVQLIMASFLFSFQIYGDFSGYSDMALGSAKLLGFDLLRNFSYPYFSRDIAEFWRKWHISLSSWFKDYVYIPLGGSKQGKLGAIKNTFIIFLLSGFWHGANWTFIVWGFINAMLFLPLQLAGKNRKYLGVIAEHRLLPSLNEFIQITATFVVTTFTWIIFRSDSLKNAIEFVRAIGSNKGSIDQLTYAYALLAVLILVFFEWQNRHSEIPFITIKNKMIRRSTYLLVTLLIFFMGAFINPRSFIYFQF